MSRSLSTSSLLSAESSTISRTLSFAPDRTKLPDCPFGLDYDYRGLQAPASPGFRTGGPKEARLFRVALLSPQKDVDNLHPVKVTNIPRTASPEKLQNYFQQFGDIGDVYIPRNLKNLTPAQDFAIVRFKDREGSQKALAELSKTPPHTRKLDNQVICVKEVERQNSIFSNNTGALGISNDPRDSDESRFHKSSSIPIQQNIKLSECFSRNGYPWGSKRPMKILEPHAPRDTLNMPGIKLTNLDPNTSSEEVEAYFSQYGKVGCVYFPKPLHVDFRPKEPNIGIGFVRFADRRDVTAALLDIENSKAEIGGVVLKGEYVPPQHWPSEKSRRYW